MAVCGEIFLALIFSSNCNCDLNKCGLNVFYSKLLEPHDFFFPIGLEAADRKTKIKTHFSLVMETPVSLRNRPVTHD